MKLTSSDLQSLCNIAIRAAKNAGQYIISFDQSQLKVDFKRTDNSLGVQGGDTLASQVVTEVDIKSQELILKELQDSFKTYDLGLLTEELVDDNTRFKKDYFWCIDPLDGTLPFTERRPGYAVSIALVSKEGIPMIGVVFDPVKNELFHAIYQEGAFKNNVPMKSATPPNQFLFIYDLSFKNNPYFNNYCNKLKDFSLSKGFTAFKSQNFGGAVINALQIIEHGAACYFKLPRKVKGGGSLWDFAATSCIFNELKISNCNILGEPLNLNNPITTFMHEKGIIYTSHPEVSQFIQDVYQKQ